MSSILIRKNTKVEVEEILSGISDLGAAEVEDFLQRIALVLANKKAPHLSSEESFLMLKISSGYPPQLLERYVNLKEKHNLTASEVDELLRISDTFETLDADRLQYLFQLAQIKNMTLGQLLSNLEGTKILSPTQE